MSSFQVYDNYYSKDHDEWDYILESVLEDIEQMMMLDAIPPLMSSAANTSISAISPLNSGPNTSMNTTNLAMNVTLTKFKPDNYLKCELKDHIFISKDCTYRLSQYIVLEDWAKDGVLLYKYLDYIFRCQLFNEQVTKVQDKNTNGEFLIFHTGLMRRSDHEYLYVLLYPNFISKTHKNRQKWRVQFGNVCESFLSKRELLHKLHSSLAELLPQRTIFAKRESDTIYHAMYDIEVSWTERLITNQDRIYKVIGERAFFDKARKHLKLTQLIDAFNAALIETKRMCSMNPELAVAQGFVDTKRRKYRMELLLPLIVQFEGLSYSFALAVAPSSNSLCYTVKSVLTLNMGYNNARLVGFVNSLWLKI